MRSRKKENGEKEHGAMRLVEEEENRKVKEKFLIRNQTPQEVYLENVSRCAPMRTTADGAPEDIDAQTGLPRPARPDHSTNTVDYIWGQMMSLEAQKDWPEVCAQFPDECLLTETLTRIINSHQCHTAEETANMWVPMDTWIEYATRHMENPPPKTQEGRDWFYRQFVQTDFMKKADKGGYPLGFEALHLRKDFINAGLEPIAFMETSFDDRADQTVLGHVHRCVGKKEYIEMRNMTPRYIRCTMRIDCRMCPTALNASQLPCFEDGMRIGYFRVPAMQMADIEKHLRNGICSLHGGCTRMDLRYCGPTMGFTFNGINNMSLGLVGSNYRTTK